MNLQGANYLLKLDESGKKTIIFNFTDGQKTHKEFWSEYERPPKEQYQNKILDKRHLLAPKNKKEYQGAFYTPRIWALKAKEYLEEALGKGFEKEYYIYDCAAGTGNLLEVFDESAKNNIYASTLDESDVKIMLSKVKNSKKFPLFEKHIFQFDFLNDNFFDEVDKKGKIIKKSKMPRNLQEILQDEEKRKKLIIFINPPYAEAGNKSKINDIKQTHKPQIATNNTIYKYYKNILGKASNELFAQFFIRIYKELSNCILASFATPKYLNSTNFITFRKEFKAKILGGFLCLSTTFDNNQGKFPISFIVWNTKQIETFSQCTLDVYTLQGKKGYENAKFEQQKGFYVNEKSINQWLNSLTKEKRQRLGILMTDAPDFAHNEHIAILNEIGKAHLIFKEIYDKNLITICIYIAVRLCIPHSWINHNDQFLYPNDKWIKDKEFQNDCLIFSVLNENKNKIKQNNGHNHFIPFSENEINAKEAFKSNFMFQFINGKIKNQTNNALFADNFIPQKPLKFSPQAKAVLDAGREIFKYYHENATNDEYNANASLYDIKAYFQGRNEKGKMNTTSKDENYNALIANLRKALKNLALKIEPKIYEYEFLRK